MCGYMWASAACCESRMYAFSTISGKDDWKKRRVLGNSWEMKSFLRGPPAHDVPRVENDSTAQQTWRYSSCVVYCSTPTKILNLCRRFPLRVKILVEKENVPSWGGTGAPPDVECLLQENEDSNSGQEMKDFFWKEWARRGGDPPVWGPPGMARQKCHFCEKMKK